MSYMKTYLADAVEAALEMLLWVGTEYDEYNDSYRQMEDRWDVTDIDAEDVAKLTDMLMVFIQGAWDEGLAGHMSAEVLGYNFILSANSHGAGFWDLGLGAEGDRLHALAKPYGDVELYVTDNNTIVIFGV